MHQSEESRHEMKLGPRRPRGWAWRYLLATGMLIAGAPSSATMYSCRDANGSPLLQNSTYGCVSEVCEIKASGAKDCEETKEQRLDRETKEKHETECKDKRRRSMMRELELLDKYPKRMDIDVQRDRELAANARELRRAREERAGARKTLQKLNVEADFYRPKRPIPGELAADIAYSTKRLADLETDITSAETKAAQINQHYDELLKHYDRLLKHEFEAVLCDQN